MTGCELKKCPHYKLYDDNFIGAFNIKLKGAYVCCYKGDQCIYDEDDEEGNDAAPELKPCPFCGNTKTDIDKAYSHAGPGENPTQHPLFWVICTQCFCCGPAENTKKEAITAWNRRTEVV
ncbi:hypothetical protein FACS1894151_08440 [Spirochaetia bacterium]|nr:hypothetical protein FACS1894151_08440 [Spirochaetia bacterium]